MLLVSLNELCTHNDHTKNYIEIRVSSKPLRTPSVYEGFKDNTKKWTKTSRDLRKAIKKRSPREVEQRSDERPGSDWVYQWVQTSRRNRIAGATLCDVELPLSVSAPRPATTVSRYCPRQADDCIGLLYNLQHAS